LKFSGLQKLLITDQTPESVMEFTIMSPEFLVLNVWNQLNHLFRGQYVV